MPNSNNKTGPEAEIAALNKTVHVGRYNKIIVDCVAMILHTPGSH
jgi:hypothetical protein